MLFSIDVTDENSADVADIIDKNPIWIMGDDGSFYCNGQQVPFLASEVWPEMAQSLEIRFSHLQKTRLIITKWFYDQQNEKLIFDAVLLPIN